MLIVPFYLHVNYLCVKKTNPLYMQKTYPLYYPLYLQKTYPVYTCKRPTHAKDKRPTLCTHAKDLPMQKT